MQKQPVNRHLVQDLDPVGRDLHRPECVLVSAAGDCYVPDWRGGVTVVRHDGSQHAWLARSPAVPLRPNAIALTPEGDFLIANLGDDGGIWRLTRDCALHPVLTHVDGQPLPPVNFVTLDDRGRLWASVSTRQRPRQRAWRADAADGFIVVSDEHGARIAADGLCYTNEVRPDPSGRWLVAVETFARRLIRFPLREDGTLGARECVCVMGDGFFPDGFAFDEAGGIWITSLVSNRLVRLSPDGTIETVIEDEDTDFVRDTEQAFAAGHMAAEHLGPIPGARLQHLTSLAFGGEDRRTVFLGSLHGTCLYRLRVSTPGVAPVHQTFPAP
jgi:hypothetical protein